MNLTIILIIIIIIVAIIFILKIFGKIIKTMISLLIILIIFFGFFVYLDIKDNEKDSKKLFIIVENDKVMCGFDSESNFLGDLNLFSEYLKAGDYEKILQNYYKLFIIKSEIINDSVKFKNSTISAKDALVILKSDIVKDKNIVCKEVISNLSSEQFLIEYKRGNIIVYKETAAFKFIKMLPRSFIKTYADKIFNIN